MRAETYYALDGGLNMESPPLKLKPGEMLGVLNYELVNGGGAQRIGGYERFDGQNKPSEADYWRVNFDSGSVAIVAGDVISNVAAPTSVDETGEVLANATVTSGTWAGGDAAGYFYVTRETNRADPAFADNDILYVGGVDVATANGAASLSGAPDDATDATMTQTAIEILRARIAPPPGSGRPRGVWVYNGNKYCFRNNAGGTACVMFVATASGWSAVDLGEQISFSNANTSVQVGDTLTQGGVTAVIEHILVQTGTLGSGVNTGRLILSGRAGGNYAAGAATSTGGGSLTLSGAETAITLLPNGNYEFINANFYGAASAQMMYGCDGVNNAFQFDGSVYVPILTGMTNDAPKHIIEHKKHLFLAFANGSVQVSPIGDPTNVWTLVLGANEIGTGDEITGFSKVPNDTLGIFNRNSTYILYGTSSGGSNPWNLTTYSDEAGAIEWTAQRMSYPIYLDDRGLRDLQTSANFGDFSNATFSKKIKRLIASAKNLAISSVRVKNKDQYRLFFSTNNGIIASFADNKFQGFTEINYGLPIRTTCSVEDTDGSEVILFGSDDGYVYQMDSGTSFDGGAVEAFIRLPFNNIGSPQRNKRFFKAVIEMTVQSAMTISFTPDFTYGESTSSTEDKDVEQTGGYWNVSNWDEFVFADQMTASPEFDIDGHGTNVGILLYTNHTYENPHTIHGVTIHYSVHGIKR